MTSRTPSERLLSRLLPDEETGCLVWQGALNGSGYGVLGINYHTIRTHRFHWELKVGPIPEGFVIDHLCHNRACARIEHLRLATSGQNARNLIGPSRNSKSGHLNIHRTTNGYRVELMVNGKRISRRTRTLEEAIAYRDSVKVNLA